MLRERYARRNLFEEIEGISLEMEPVLRQLDKLLDDDRLFATVKSDLGRRYAQTLVTGRRSTPVEVVLRMLVVKHLYGWSYAQTEQWVSDSLVLRQFCRVYLERVPDDTTLIRWANVIQAETLMGLVDHVVALARELKVSKGRKLRIDSTVVETNIHYPVDSVLLTDGIRVVGRLVSKACQYVGSMLPGGKRALQAQTQHAHQHMLHIMEVARQRGAEAEAHLQTAYRDLVQLTTEVVARATSVADALKQHAERRAQHLAAQLATFLPRVNQVIDQTSQRVLAHQSVPAAQKLVSVFEPHTAIIRKGKIGKAVEFGRVVWLDEVEGGLITRFAILPGNPPDADQLKPSLDHHRTVFDRPPRLLAGDRKVFSPTGETYATQQGVQYVVLPKPGAKSPLRLAHERQPWFRSGRNWRSGHEAHIGLLKRRFGLRRCLYHGDQGMYRWVGWGVIAFDLWTIARKVAA